MTASGPTRCLFHVREMLLYRDVLHTTSMNDAFLTVDLVDFRVGGEDLVSQFLSSGKHLGVMGCDQILNQLLQLVSVHLEQRLRDGQPQLHLQHANKVCDRTSDITRSPKLFLYIKHIHAVYFCVIVYYTRVFLVNFSKIPLWHNLLLW